MSAWRELETWKRAKEGIPGFETGAWKAGDIDQSSLELDL